MLAIVFAFLGLIFGAILAIFVRDRREKYIEYAECLASGFMLAVVFFDLLPNAMEKTKFITVFLGLLTGIVIILLISQISLTELCTKIPKCGIMKNNKKSIEVLTDSAGNYSQDKRLMRNLTTAMAVALHNIPEGIALGALEGQAILISTAVLIALHNIPEGLAMSIPLAKIGVKWYKILFFAIITGAFTILGWGVGVMVSGISQDVIAFLLAISSGAMLQIVFGELIINGANRRCGNFTLLGLMIGMVIAVVV